MDDFGFPVDLSVDGTGRVLVKFPDVPGCLTDGGTEAQALAEAGDALEEALAVIMGEGKPIPLPSPAEGRPLVRPGSAMLSNLVDYRLKFES